MSGASVTLAEDRPDAMEKIVRISGTPEQADKAQSLLQGFILSSESLSLSRAPSCGQYMTLFPFSIFSPG
jgi:hypothetical protein